MDKEHRDELARVLYWFGAAAAAVARGADPLHLQKKADEVADVIAAALDTTARKGEG